MAILARARPGFGTWVPLMLFPLVPINTPPGASVGRYPELEHCCNLVFRIVVVVVLLLLLVLVLAIRVKERECVRVVFEG